jgi:methylase of polypeptide subunit release factors
VGTGSGVHALLAARHARHVIATDVNERALAYTKLNAALNGLTNIECRQGSLFEPVAGEKFDLVVCNAPYVVSPETRWAYRDSEFQADELSERVVRSAAEHLAPGGFASVLVSWLAADESDPDERVIAWAEATDCDSWILASMNSDPLDHAAEWNSHLAGDTKAYDEALAEWTHYFDQLGVRRVSEGAVLLHRRDGEPTSRLDPLDEDDLDDASDQIERAFEARAWLAGLGRSSELLDERLALAMPLRLERELEPEDDATVITDERVELTEGTKHAVETTEDALEVLTSLNGQPLRDVVHEVADRLALTDAETVRLSREAVSLSRELLELGALRVR